ncbi:MAG: GAF domain-containing protein [Deltaproteobacteria bacterium]|nr:MAG: GAF domain-containing protein [Deltaproteobacteria bacterium]
MSLNMERIALKFNTSGPQDRNEALAALLKLSNFLTSTSDLGSLLDGALSIVLDHFDLDAGRIYVMDDTGQCLTLVAHRGLDIAGLEKVHLNEGFSGKSARTKSVIVQHISELEDCGRAELLARKSFEIIVCVPFIVMDRVEGVINLASKKAIRLSQEDIDLLMAMGQQIGVACSHVRTYMKLQEKVREVQDNEEAIKFFACSTFHDLKSPSVGLCGLTKRLHKEYVHLFDDKGKSYVDHILQVTGQIVSSVEQINAYITTREVPLRQERVGTKAVLARLRQEISGLLEERRIRWVESAALPEIVADELCIVRIFRNLLDNAMKYGGVGLSEIRFQFRETNTHHVFSVSDDGVGLGEVDRDRLFQVFQRQATSRGIEGSGLGLAIVREIAKRHLGDVWVESSPDPGTTFSFSISRELASPLTPSC